MPVYLDGVNLEDLGVRVSREYQHPAAPETRDYTMEIPGRHGAWDFGADLGPRRIELPCFVVKNTPADVQRTIRALMAHLFDAYGRPKTMWLVFSTEPDKYYLARISGGLPVERIYRVGRFVLPFVAYDPFAYSVATNDEVVWGSETITFEADYLMGHTGGQVQTVTSPQSYIVTVMGYTVRPTILVNGTGSNVTISANGKSFSLGSFVDANWIVDGENYTVTKGGKNALSEFSGDFLDLLPGENTVTISGSGLNLTVQIKFRDKYL